MGAPSPPGAVIPPWFVEPTLAQRFFGVFLDGLVLAPLSLLYLVSDSAWTALAILGVDAVYETALTARSGQTLGKMAMGTRAVDSVDGSGIAPDRAALRWLVKRGLVAGLGLLAPIAILELGYALALSVAVLRPPLHQGFHDLAAGTLVTSVRRR